MAFRGKQLSPKPIRLPLKSISVVLALVCCVTACGFKDRNEVKSWAKPVRGHNADPLVTNLSNIVNSEFAIQYQIEGTGVISHMDIALKYPRAKVATNFAGADIDIYTHMNPVNVLICPSAGGLKLPCKKQDSSPDTKVEAAEIIDPTMYDTLVKLFSTPGAEVSERTIVGAEAVCLTTPPVGGAKKIQLCLAKRGGVLYYNNGEYIIQATNYKQTVPNGLLDPPPQPATDAESADQT